MEAAQAFVLPFLATTIVVSATWYVVAHWNDAKKDKAKPDRPRGRRR